MQYLKNYLKQVIFALIGFGALFGYKMYNKGSSHDSMKADLVQACAKEKPCIGAVNKHFDACFEGAYSAGGRRKGSSFDQSRFLSCFNEKSGKTYFSADQAH